MTTIKDETGWRFRFIVESHREAFLNGILNRRSLWFGWCARIRKYLKLEDKFVTDLKRPLRSNK